MTTDTHVADWRGRTAADRDGNKVGSIDEIYMDTATGQPEWLAVKTGLLGSKLTFVPIAGASEGGDDVVVIAYDKQQVKDAPNAEADGELSHSEEAELYRHYGLEYEDDAPDASTEREGTDRDRTDRDRTDRDRTNDGDASAGGGQSDDAMTRSEEELRVGTTQRESGRARLRKYVVTEQVEETVPVRREEARLEREPITDANVGDAQSGPEISEEEHEVVLHEEEVVTEKRAVPKERVRLEKDTVTEEQSVSEEVRKERIEADGPGIDTRDRD